MCGVSRVPNIASWPVPRVVVSYGLVHEGFCDGAVVGRPSYRADLPFQLALWSDSRVARTLGGPRNAEQVERALGEAIWHWHSYGFGRWILRRDGAAVGTVKLAHCDVLARAEVELGYALLPGAWGHGYGTEAGAGALVTGITIGSRAPAAQ